MNEMRKLLNIFESEQEDIFSLRLKCADLYEFYQEFVRYCLKKNYIAFNFGHDLKDTYIDSTRYEDFEIIAKDKLGKIENSDLLEAAYHNCMADEHLLNHLEMLATEKLKDEL